MVGRRAAECVGRGPVKAVLTIHAHVRKWLTRFSQEGDLPKLVKERPPVGKPELERLLNSGKPSELFATGLRLDNRNGTNQQKSATTTRFLKGRNDTKDPMGEEDKQQSARV